MLAMSWPDVERLDEVRCGYVTFALRSAFPCDFDATSVGGNFGHTPGDSPVFDHQFAS